VTTPVVEAPPDRPVPGPSGPSATWSLVRLAAVVAAVVLLGVLTGTGALVVVIVALVVMVMVHELGHFLAAKWSHMKVTEYFLGFGPRVWSIRRGETEYGIKAIPAGGYVKIPGMTNLEEVDPEDEPRTYRQQPFHNRLAVALAGSTMHFVMAFLLAWAALAFIGLPSGPATQVQSVLSWKGGHPSAAQQAGLRPGDVIEAVNGRRVTSAAQLEQVIDRSIGAPVHLEVRSGASSRRLTVVPHRGGSSIGEGTSSRGYIGVSLQSPSVTQGPVSAIGSSFVDIGHVVSGAASGIGQIFSLHGITSYVHQVTNSKVAARDARNGTPRLESIVGAARTAVQGARAGPIYLLEVLIAINVFIGIVNLFPMLPLDGGHVVIAVYERIRTRRGRPAYHADAAKLLPVAYLVVALLLVVFASSLFLDITHPIANPFK